MDNQAFFEKLCWEGLERRYGPNVPQANKDRLEYEIGVVKRWATRTTILSCGTT